MSRFTPTELQILAALEIHESAGDVARETGAPLKQVIHLQRLYGSADIQAQRRQEDAESQVRIVLKPRKSGKVPKLHSDQEKLSSPYGAYWRQLLSPPVPRAPRIARMVPDDRADEASPFNWLLGTLAKAFSREARA